MPRQGTDRRSTGFARSRRAIAVIAVTERAKGSLIEQRRACSAPTT
jgi:hypothetical protein